MLGIIGAGSWGTALALQAAACRQAPVILWEFDARVAATLQAERRNQPYLPDVAFSDNLIVTNDLQQCATQCDTMLVAVPSVAFRGVLQQLKPLLNAAQGLAWATKGLDPDSGELLCQVAQQIFGEPFPLAVLSGPSFALEVALRQPTAVSLAANDESLSQRVVAALHSDTFRIYTSGDVLGVCLGGAYKNVLAIAAGIADGLSLGHNARAALITRGLNEMRRLGTALGGETETFMGLAGLGDLMLTCTGDLSRNRRLGMALAGNHTLSGAQSDIGQVTEGVETARVIHKLADTHAIDLPIAAEVYQVLFNDRSPAQAVSNLLAREQGEEF